MSAAPRPTPSSAWNITRYPGQLSWTVHRYLDVAQSKIEWLRNSTGQVVRYRSELAALAAAERANEAEQATA